MDLFNNLSEDIKRHILKQNSAMFQNQISQLLSQEMLKVAQNTKSKTQQTPQISVKTPPVIQNFAAEQILKNVASLKNLPPSTSKTPTQLPQSKPKSAKALKYKALRDELSRDNELVRKVSRSRFDNTKAKEFFSTKEHMTDESLKAIAEYCEIESSDIKRSRIDGIPIQRMWWKRFNGKRQPKGPHGEDIVQPNFPFKSIDENLCSNSQLQLVIQYLLSRNSGAIKGQSKDFEKKFRELDPRLNESFLDIFDDSQPLMSHVVITDDMISKQEEKVTSAKRKFEEFLKTK